MFYFIALIFCFLNFFTLHTLAAPTSHDSEVHYQLLQKEAFKKNIYKGDQEVDLRGAFGYNEFYGIALDADVTYRYFLSDKFSLGPILGMETSQLEKKWEAGVSARWYFAEYRDWAFSLTQNFLHYNASWEVPGLSHSDSRWIGQTQLGVHYFFTPKVSLGLYLNME